MLIGFSVGRSTLTKVTTDATESVIPEAKASVVSIPVGYRCVNCYYTGVRHSLDYGWSLGGLDDIGAVTYFEQHGKHPVIILYLNIHVLPLSVVGCNLRDRSLKIAQRQMS